MSRHQGSSRGDESLRSENDLSLHSRGQDPESLRNTPNLNIRDPPSDGSSTSNREPVCSEIETRAATEERFVSTSRPRTTCLSEPSLDCLQTEQIPILHTRECLASTASSKTNYASDDDNTGQASYRSQTQRQNEPTTTSREQRPVAATAASGTEGATRSRDSYVQIDECYQTEPKSVAFDEALTSSSMQGATGGSAYGRETGQNAAAAGMEASAVASAHREHGGHQSIDLLLIGKTGNGKSATGNSILGRKAFKSSADANSVTKFIYKDVCMSHERVITVVDAPGVGDTLGNDEKSVKKIQLAMQFAIAYNTRGYDAFILVFRFGSRFTREEKNAIKFLKTTFGKDFIKKHCILVMTFGDSFDNHYEETNQTFEQWLVAQTGDFKKLIEECEGRIVLFYNATKDNKQRELQLRTLLQFVDRLENRYTDANFDEAARKRKELEKKGKGKVISEEWHIKLSLLLQKFEETQKLQNPAEQAEPFAELHQEIEALQQELCKFDSRTDDFRNFMGLIQSVKDSLQEEIRILPERLDDKEEPEAERCRRQRVPADLYNEYQKVKTENDQGFLSKLVGAIAWPFVKTKEWFVPQQSP